MASTIASPIPLPHGSTRPTRKEIVNLQPHDDGRGTPLPQYEKTQSVPFTLSLQEEKNNPGQFQLVVNVDPSYKPQPSSQGSSSKPASAKKLYANLNDVPSLGYDVSSLYRTQKSSPPPSPQHEKGWSELDAIPPDFLQKVVPDWKVTFSRSDSTASTQSRKLADIKARIKKSGKGFVVRLLKGGNSANDEVAEIHLGRQAGEDVAVLQELDSCTRAELDATEAVTPSSLQERAMTEEHPNVFEIGTSSEPGIPRPPLQQPITARYPSITSWINQSTSDARPRNSIISEEGFSDAETLIPDLRSINDRLDEDQTDLEPFSRNSSVYPTRTASVSSIVKTPTRGLSVVGPVKRVEKGCRVRGKGKGKAGRLDLTRSDARKSVKRRSPQNSTSGLATGSTLQNVEPAASSLRHRSGQNSYNNDDDRLKHPPSADDSAFQQSIMKKRTERQRVNRRMSAEDLPQPSKPKSKLRLQTDVQRPKSANPSPVARRKKSPRAWKPDSPSPAPSISPMDNDEQIRSSSTWCEVDQSDELRIALEQAFGDVANDLNHVPESSSRTLPRIEEPIVEDHVGEIPLPPGLEVRSAPVNNKSRMSTFLGLALSALSEKAFEGFQALRERYGSEPPVPSGHVRVRWTCSCGEQLYDDFVERRSGAARLLEAYLNRPRTHTPTSPTSRTSTSTSMSSVFSSVSSASTLATPASTYGGPLRSGISDSSKYSPTRLRSNNPFSVRIGTWVEESWLLTCANEGRFTPKIVHVDVNAGRIKSDKDLALALREHYDQVNGRRWFNWARLRGLTTIEFVQFEVHRNRFADIRATPSMPPKSSSSVSSGSNNEKSSSPSQHPYSFEPIDLLPPVGSTYLLHLFRHPSDYDGELITYLRAPKRRERLEFGMGWGINLVEGFLAQKVWTLMMSIFGVGSAIFAVFWTVKEGDMQGAFGVAGWVVSLAALVVAGLQAWLD